MRGEMPAFDGRSDRTGWVAVTPTNGWSDAVYYSIASGKCTLLLDLTKAAWGPEVMVQLPPAAVPKPTLPAAMYFWGASRATGAQAPVFITASGAVACVLGSTTTGGGGIVGTVTYPV